MTLPVACPPLSACSSEPPTLPQRKRRRRAPASGALDDCFACTKRNVKCDRRRPYCSPCLEVGKECSGYKTQLTWGVGVASRGKLRGLSLPVARSAPAPRSPPTPNRPRRISHASGSKALEGDEVKIKREEPSSRASIPASPYTTYDFVNMAPQGVSPPIHHEYQDHQEHHDHHDRMPEWNLAVSHEYHPLPDYHQQNHHHNHHHHQEGMSHQRQLPQLHRLHTFSLGRADAIGLGSSIDSLSTSYAESDDYAPSPISQSFPDDASYMHSPITMYNNNNNNYSSRNSVTDSPAAGFMADSRGPTSCPEHYYASSEISSSISSHQNHYDVIENRQQQSPPGARGLFYDDDMLGSMPASECDMYATSARASHFGWTSVSDDDARSQTASETDPYNLGHESRSSSYSSEMSPRVSFFLDYYEKIICPSVVFIDSPENPYREQILALAATSKSLQHAICALAACNLRMKRKQSLGQDHWRLAPLELEFQDWISGGSRPVPVQRSSNHPLSPNTPPPSDSSVYEEHQHRTLAVHLLNQQLSDPHKARHDCVLATLFILCHYRMCESGIAQFRTQFAGVKKILGMRDSGVETGNWGWMETLFTFYDGISASINNREAQLRGGYLEMIANPVHPNHALENFAGCDSVLFKVIGKLGRLNMLSQHRPVLDLHADSFDMEPRRPILPRPRPGLAGQALADFYNLHAHNFDGNGFASTLDDDASFSALASTSSHDGMRTTFWAEWKAARLALQNWEFDPIRLVATLPVTPSPTQLRDLGYISEAFRYAALLYTERLACPNIPSSHLNLQNLVSQVLYYVTSLEQGSGAEKFLLWPLFISGSECVNELQQGIVRTKCREIMGRSGYLNNLAGQEVLEKLWAENEGMKRNGDFGTPFRWSRYMEGSDGEWIMV
ncbi:uncharacterized protein L3040_003940 [Drepanopeziza brunnea f. sp. 'multigermtubi']|uniref:Fungal transcriptional regulatory protein n=1 Tax=Marssonina brunnea f. sp. multigermtubi (strain MB_m1) TaxID=1072389 RepID=K1WR35_MARBU|nr:fungal transcriptional regulatory protein [Drepanopeziza brunnea f. sp. 'multigermtubi' MB_m1]EKD14842.1 fungal transcriptional regulatory protein [Drepanopeziza brunnea f. sp. 'multigermtubi' MB_m1]KAJ5046708.1 hypothetical protein L3040_003940 [Drepanopeziza brunnea f. sp. 'multigermtubi']